MATSLKPPTSTRGWVSDQFFHEVLDELTEDLPPALVWPLSVSTYTSMARESRVAAVLGGYELQLRRAQWQVDGRGCRPEATRLVADGLGLSVAGKDEVTGARTRGVSWSEHLRAALLSLRYGHYGFHLHADTSSGQAKLIGLYDRPPWTISQIHADPKTGAFQGITQDYNFRANGTPQIRAENLCWYVHDRIGAAWFGNSLLKAAWPAYHVKREMLRVHGTANRRWSAGVPVMEALPGSTPTPEQMSEAAQLAMAARAGEQAGASTPPGFTMKILGITGQIPDTLAFMEFLNREIAGAVLMPHLDLGTGTSGSRATATAFIDSWTLALEAIGESAADTVTRQVAARIVGWNYGDDEPVPRVTVSGVGSRREVTAESLKMLLDAGALSSDPALEEWVRREYRLPEREATKPDVPSTPVAASVRRSPRKQRKEPATQLALPILAAADVPSSVDPAAIAAEWQAAMDELAQQWEDQSGPLVEAIVAAVVAAQGIAGLGTLAADAAVVAGLAATIGAGSVGLAAAAMATAAGELARIGVTVTPVVDQAKVQAAADVTAAVVASGYVNGATRVALNFADTDEAKVASAVRAHLLDLSTATGHGFVAGNLAQLLTLAQAEGRMAAFTAAAEAGTDVVLVASEINDQSRCTNCGEVDGRRYDTVAAALTDYPAGRFVDCLGSCRGFVYAVLPD